MEKKLSEVAAIKGRCRNSYRKIYQNSHRKRVDIESITLLQHTFQKFSDAPGLQANLDKSPLYVAGVSQEVKSEILHLLGYAEGTLPFKYLGVPLATKKLNISQCLPLDEKITAKITYWSARMFSYVGKVHLIKAVLFGMQLYWAQIFVLPKKIMKMIEVVCRSFPWTGARQISKKALVSWEKICYTRADEGLNVINLKLWNKAAVMKQLWAIFLMKDSLWIKWVHYYYIKQRDLTDMELPKNASCMVRKILGCRDIMLQRSSIQG
ncbi:uncharacterized protein LOC107874342 [Capsicum annuum]|uniref:uncharacterized protein LOC107874342 n=1 Tax=Capsicum annuum TaxID=4072 RepID=UPI001FB19632|nr:uncharacterized protein LOC107874342 [Capsicum annuum]